VLSDKIETAGAIAVADSDFPAWPETSPLKRAIVMFSFKALLEANRDEPARLFLNEHGKVYSDAVGEVTCEMDVVEYACGIPHLQKGEHSANVGTRVDSASVWGRYVGWHGRY
jgi:malonate-semialdehyde dehydrogenase (acetylating)/methylmalonate-semialdehyde dehydrogenase